MAKKQVRVSCANLGIVQIGEYYAMLKSKGSAVPKYSAIGGHSKTSKKVKEFLQYKCDAKFEENSDDLILYIPKSKINHFRSWYKKRMGRDNLDDELREELTEENSILKTLEGLTSEYMTTDETIAKSTRKGSNGELTYYFIDIYEVKLTDDQEDSMLNYAAAGDTLALLTKEELSLKHYNGAQLQADWDSKNV